MPPTPFEVSPELRDLAVATQAATGLEILGIDVVMGRTKPAVIDVNPFPSFKGVEGGLAAVARYLADLARG